MEEINAKVEQLGRANRNNRIMAVVGAVFCVIAVLMLVRNQMMISAIMAAACIATFLLAREMNRSYVQQATEANLRYGLGGSLDRFSYKPTGGISEKEFQALELLPLAQGRGRLLSRNWFSGEKDGLTLSGSEITFHFKAETGGTAGYHFLSGSLLQAKGPRRAGDEDFLFLREELCQYPEVKEYLEEIYIQPPRVLEGWRCFTKDQLPQDWLLEKLKGVPETVTALRLSPDTAAVYMDRRFYTGSKYPASMPTAQRLQGNTLPERDDLWQFFRWWLSVKE